MAAPQKAVEFNYLSHNYVANLTDVKGQLQLNGVLVPAAGTLQTFTAVDAVNAKGQYRLALTPAQLTGFGLLPGQENFLTVYVTSTTDPGVAIQTKKCTIANEDDIYSQNVTTQAAIAALAAQATQIIGDLETGPANLATLLAGINQIKSNTGYALAIPQLIRPATGSEPFRVEIRVYDDDNNLIDPDGNALNVAVANQAGATRGTYLANYVSGTDNAPAVRRSKGNYYQDITIPSNAVAPEQYTFNTSYTVNGGTPKGQVGVQLLQSDVNADGFAQQATSTQILTLAQDIDTLSNGVNGFAAIKAQTALIQTQTDKIADATIGLAAAKAQRDTILAQAQANGAAIATLSTFVMANLNQSYVV